MNVRPGMSSCLCPVGQAGCIVVIACDKREAFAQGSEATKQSNFIAAKLDCFASLAMTVQLLPRQFTHMLDDPRKIHPAMARRIERLVDFLRMLAERRRR